MITDDNVLVAGWREKGNEAFKNANWLEAIKGYTEGLKLSQINSKDSRELRIVLLKNRAATYLKIDNAQLALDDSTQCLELSPDDPKALFRRCQALEALERYEEAYRDAQRLFTNDPHNQAIQPYLQRLHATVQARLQHNNKLTTRFERMLATVTDGQQSADVRTTAINNILVLVRDNAGAELALNSCHKLRQLLLATSDVHCTHNTVKLGCIRVVSQLCHKSTSRTEQILALFADADLTQLLYTRTSTDEISALQFWLQTMLTSLSVSAQAKDNTVSIERLLCWLIATLKDRVVSAQSRDAIIEVLLKNCHHEVIAWAPEFFVEHAGVEHLLECSWSAGHESALPVTTSTATLASCCLSRVYDNMYYDAARERFRRRVDDYLDGRLNRADYEAKLEATAALTMLLRGPLDVGNQIVARAGILEMLLAMATTHQEREQLLAIECLVAAASKADKAQSIIARGIPVLKQLYKTGVTDGIRVRALVGLCKLGTHTGADASKQPFADGATSKLSHACRQFLKRDSPDTKRWAAEGLSYLTLDAEVKEALIEDEAALGALLKLPTGGDKACTFGVAATLVNLVNAYDKQELPPEMVELARFAKQHVPETSALDEPDFVRKRVLRLGEMGAGSALVALTNAAAELDSVKEFLARVFNSLAGEQELRGVLVQQGSVKALLKLATVNNATTTTTTKNQPTDKGKLQASQALARLAISIDPRVAFPGQRALEVIRPLLGLLHPDCSALENFEGLLALCNLAQMGNDTRKRICDDSGLSKIEHYMFEEHVMLRRAATQCLTNLTMLDQVVDIYAEGCGDRLKYLVALVLDEDGDTVMAAAGALAMLTEASPTCCQRLFTSNNWLDAIHTLLMADKQKESCRELLLRGVCIVKNVVEASKETAEQVIATDVMEILMVLSRLGTDKEGQGASVDAIVKSAECALRAAEKWGLIQKPLQES